MKFLSFLCFVINDVINDKMKKKLNDYKNSSRKITFKVHQLAPKNKNKINILENTILI